MNFSVFTLDADSFSPWTSISLIPWCSLKFLSQSELALNDASPFRPWLKSRAFSHNSGPETGCPCECLCENQTYHALSKSLKFDFIIVFCFLLPSSLSKTGTNFKIVSLFFLISDTVRCQCYIQVLFYFRFRLSSIC